MVALSRAVDGLVAAATSQVDPRALKGIVEKVLDGFDAAPEAEQDAALRTIGRALGKVDGRGAQILSLALGALAHRVDRVHRVLEDRADDVRHRDAQRVGEPLELLLEHRGHARV